MNEHIRYWTSADTIQVNEKAIPIRQVYVWCITLDKKIIIVSKDGASWQFPGGKPENGEAIMETAIREMHEETGVDINPYASSTRMFGYYTVSDPKSNPTNYLQIRLITKLSVLSNDLPLTVHNEDFHQSSKDTIRFVSPCAIDELQAHIPWLTRAPEYTAAMQLL